MADKKNTWRTFVGTVQFDPSERDVNGKKVLNIGVRPSGVKDQSILVSATLWPSHKEYFSQIEKGTVVAIEGKFDVRRPSDPDANPYYNLSVTGLAILGKLDYGVRDDEPDDEPDDAGDDESW